MAGGDAGDGVAPDPEVDPLTDVPADAPMWASGTASMLDPARAPTSVEGVLHPGAYTRTAAPPPLPVKKFSRVVREAYLTVFWTAIGSRTT